MQIFIPYPQLSQGPTINLNFVNLLFLLFVYEWSLKQPLLSSFLITVTAGSYLMGKTQYLNNEKAGLSYKQYYLLVVLVPSFFLTEGANKESALLI